MFIYLFIQSDDYLFQFSFLFFLTVIPSFFMRQPAFCNPVGRLKTETKVSPQMITGNWCVTVITVRDYIF